MIDEQLSVGTGAHGIEIDIKSHVLLHYYNWPSFSRCWRFGIVFMLAWLPSIIFVYTRAALFGFYLVTGLVFDFIYLGVPQFLTQIATAPVSIYSLTKPWMLWHHCSCILLRRLFIIRRKDHKKVIPIHILIMPCRIVFTSSLLSYFWVPFP